MALYTSWYTRQLALRPEAVGADQGQGEGEKTLQQAVARRTVDIIGPYVTWFEVGWLAVVVYSSRSIYTYYVRSKSEKGNSIHVMLEKLATAAAHVPQPQPPTA
jgi:hypothetical protein